MTIRTVLAVAILAAVPAAHAAHAQSHVVAPALLVSLDGDRDSGVLSELGVRLPVAGRLAFRAGVAVLTTVGGEAGVDPTIRLDLKLGGAR
jgi:hypothetical protein